MYIICHKHIGRCVYTSKTHKVEHFNQLYKLHYSMVYHLITTMLGESETADDLVQDVFVKLYVQLTSGEPVEFSKTWLYRVVGCFFMPGT